ncbi:MAG: response regulator [Oligoflexia bacterium]|nr:response regulator [Oligoflexia bacterium]
MEELTENTENRESTEGISEDLLQYTHENSKIVIVEDTRIPGKKLKFYLERLKYKVLWEKSGEEALALLAAHDDIDLVITGIQMPGMDGLEMLALIRANSKLKRIPVMVMTSMEEEAICEEAIRLGADDFLSTPFKPRELGLRIHNMILRKKSEAVAITQLRAIENTMDGVAIINREGDYIYVNDAHVKVFGFIGHQKIIGSNFEFFYPPAEVIRLRQEILPIFNKQGYWLGEVTGKRMDGQLYPQELALTKLDDERFLSICRDISERKRSEQEQQELKQKIMMSMQMASMGNLAAGVAHEINNPLTIFLGYLRSLRHHFELAARSTDPLSSEQMTRLREIVAKLSSTSKRIAKTVGALKLYSRIGPQCESVPIDVHEEIVNAIELCEQSYKLEAGITIKSELHATKSRVYGDPASFGSMLNNLLSNAKDALLAKKEESAERLILLQTENSAAEKLDAKLRVKIIDCGVGISTSNLPHIFDPFYTTKDVGKGMGLGLAICYSIVREMHGEIDATSRPGEGTTITLSLPLLL